LKNHLKTRMSYPFAGAAIVLAFMLAIPALAQNGPRGKGPGSGKAVAGQALTEGETETLLYMREEEKLARDVYRQFHEKWGLIIFENISASEDRHANAIARKLRRYGIEDPATNLPGGVFSIQELNTLYAALIAQGSQSHRAALEVGVLIEKKDIADLEEALLVTGQFDIKRVYTNLLQGSLNHLEAFENTLEAVCQATAQ